jgi:hypothetical protein
VGGGHDFLSTDSVFRSSSNWQAILGPGTVIPDSARNILQLLLEQVEQ